MTALRERQNSERKGLSTKLWQLRKKDVPCLHSLKERQKQEIGLGEAMEGGG